MPTALFSLWDKSPWLSLARTLHRRGWDILASEGTAAFLAQYDIPARTITDWTQSPPVLGGRVKTLHPRVFAGILARNLPQDHEDLARLQSTPVDLVAVSLYPFQQVVQDPNTDLATALEHIDIGGVALIRAAAKNFPRVTVLVDPRDAVQVQQELENRGSVSLDTRRRLALKAFAWTAAYDQAIASYLAGARVDVLTLYPVQRLRYGENPHQEAILYAWEPDTGPLGGRLLQGKPLSYNNLVDLDAAWQAVSRLPQPAAVVVKHASPCGLALGETLAQAVERAIASDPVSAFGGILAVNVPFDEEAAAQLKGLFLECLAAPAITLSARERLAKRKNLRVLEIPHFATGRETQWRSIFRGMLRQTGDPGDPPETAWRVVTERAPTPQEWEDLRFAWLAVQPVLSNAIVLVKDRATVGIGGGQPNRVDAVRLAVQRAGTRAQGAVLASDAFFPFPDGVEEAARAGVTAIVQPGGSIRDEEVIAAANRHDLAMVFTGVRHFRH